MNNVASVINTARTSAEIDAEITQLSKLLAIVPAYSAFGDDNHAAINAQITVLRGKGGKLSEDKVGVYSFSAVLNVGEWLTGSDPSPSGGWMDMVVDEDGPVN